MASNQFHYIFSELSKELKTQIECHANKNSGHRLNNKRRCSSARRDATTYQCNEHVLIAQVCIDYTTTMVEILVKSMGRVSRRSCIVAGLSLSEFSNTIHITEENWGLTLQQEISGPISLGSSGTTLPPLFNLQKIMRLTPDGNNLVNIVKNMCMSLTSTKKKKKKQKFLGLPRPRPTSNLLLTQPTIVYKGK